MVQSLTSAIAVLGSLGTFGGLFLSFYFHKKSQEAQTDVQEVQEKLREKQEELYDEMRKRKKITWDQLPKKSRSLRDRIKRDFEPDLVVTPGLRGGTILNLMYGVTQNRLVYTGIREDKRGPEGLPSPPEKYLLVNETDKYRHYLPDGIETEDTSQNVLILDDFVHSGESMNRFKQNIVDLGFDEENVRTAAIVCSETARDADRAPDFFSVTMPSNFEFPWGEAV